VAGRIPPGLRNQLGIAVAKSVYREYCSLLISDRWRRACNFGARPQRLLWASTGTKDPTASDVLYVAALAAPFTVNTMPEATLKAFADHGQIESALSSNNDVQDALARFAESRIEIDALGAQLQDEGAKSFVESWVDLMDVIASKCSEIKRTA
jgi:transaldolase